MALRKLTRGRTNCGAALGPQCMEPCGVLVIRSRPVQPSEMHIAAFKQNSAGQSETSRGHPPQPRMIVRSRRTTPPVLQYLGAVAAVAIPQHCQQHRRQCVMTPRLMHESEAKIQKFEEISSISEMTTHSHTQDSTRQYTQGDEPKR